MPKTPSDKLYKLIKSLSSGEKRYFKIYINRKEDSNSKYVQLFDAIYAQEEFDDEALRLEIYGNEQVEGRKFSELKAYLYQLVLKSLESYDEKSSIDYRLKGYLLGVRTLFRRSFFDDCKDLLYKAKKVATEYEHFTSLIEILEWEKRIAYAQTDIAWLDRELNRISEEEAHWANCLSNFVAYRNLFFNMLLNVRKEVSRSPEQLAQMRKLMAQPLMQDEAQALSFSARVMYHRINSIYHFTASEFEAFYRSSKQLVELMESHPHLLKEDVSEYISALNNHIISCGRLQRYEEVEQTLKKLKAVKPLTKDDEAKIHRQYYQNKFRLCISSGDFDEGKKALEAHLREVEKFDQAQFSKGNFYLQYFCIYFGCGEYEKALDALNDWLSLSGSVERKDLQSLARILNLIIHYELGNSLLLESLLRSTYRYLSRENRLSEFERKMMTFIRDMNKPLRKKERIASFEAVKEEFGHLRSQPAHSVFQLFDIVSWIESKVSGKPFSQVVKERFENELRKRG